MLKKIIMGSAAMSAVLLAGCGDKPATEQTQEIAKTVKIDPATIERTATKNAYFGDLHVHTKNSFDAFITGTRTTPDDAYRFAKGATIDNGAGTDVKLSGPPLDFYGVTDNMNIIGRIDDNLGATNLHRNVVFRDKAPERLFTTLDSTNPEDLWSWMNEQRAQGVDVLAIPHNSNASNGQMFAMTMNDGSPLTKTYAENRMKNEPIVEMTQIKGTSETHPLLSPEDEFANHELYEILVGMPTESKKVPGSFVRQSLARGIGLESEIGANPYAFGFIGSTDAHVSSSSLSEENFFGKFPHDTELSNRQSIPPKGAKTWDNAQAEELDLAIISTAQYGASGLAGVWAQANTRADIFDAMAAKETFATSGPRLKTRFFAGEYADDILTQVVKVWSENGENMERIYDVACAGGAAPSPATRRCPDNGATVDLTTCQTNDETGAGELKALWNDPDYQAGQKTAYYLRVLENPKCRWSSWDAVRNGTPPNPNMEATLQDRAWSSAIWVQ